jgi:hypothetical protein
VLLAEHALGRFHETTPEVARVFAWDTRLVQEVGHVVRRLDEGLEITAFADDVRPTIRPNNDACGFLSSGDFEVPVDATSLRNKRIGSRPGKRLARSGLTVCATEPVPGDKRSDQRRVGLVRPRERCAGEAERSEAGRQPAQLLGEAAGGLRTTCCGRTDPG